MYLTRKQERMMAGDEGVAVKKSMELLVALGDVFGAEKLVPVESAHISGVSYKNLGESHKSLLRARSGCLKHLLIWVLNPHAHALLI
jgi:predicted aconitase